MTTKRIQAFKAFNSAEDAIISQASKNNVLPHPVFREL